MYLKTQPYKENTKIKVFDIKEYVMKNLNLGIYQRNTPASSAIEETYENN